VRQRDVERLDVLPGEQRSHDLDAARDRRSAAPCRARPGRGRCRRARLQVQRVLRGLEEQAIDAALDQARALRCGSARRGRPR
jgi:hypothetical protein